MKKNRELSLILILLWMGIAFAQLTNPVRFPDSGDYEIVLSPHNIFAYFRGNSYRGWPTPLLYTLTRSDRLFVIAQSQFYFASWTALIIAICREKSSRYILIVGGLLTVVALSPMSLQWNQIILSESLSISLTISSLAICYFMLSVAGRESNSSHRNLMIVASAGILFSTAATINRPSSLLLQVAVSIVLIFLVTKLGCRILSYAFSLFSILMVIYALSVATNSDRYWTVNQTEPSRTSSHYLYMSATESGYNTFSNTLFKEVSGEGPTCLHGLRASFQESGKDPWSIRSKLITECPTGVRWLNKNITQKYSSFILNHPTLYFSYLGSSFPEITSQVHYTQTRSILPAFISSIIERSKTANADFQPVVLWLLSPFLVSLRRSYIDKIGVDRHFTIVTSILVAGAFVSILFTQTLINSDLLRPAIPCTVALFVLLITNVGEIFDSSEIKV